MLRMSKLADYATVIVITMARSPDAVKSAGSLAETTGIPAPTVSKLMKTLVRGGVLVSVRGVSGGYQLALPPQQITLSDVISVIDGPFGMTECSALPGLCTQEAVCSARANWQKVDRLILEALRQVSLADMAGSTLRKADISAIHARGGLPLDHAGIDRTQVISFSPRKPAMTPQKR
ncbi:SUF system Fe-S cluster assembly regulator [Paraburkholderia sp. MMS20-SJTN17]|uniref:SUF system Fe-S cluster assembly regulator n=1 Tax=Paraburkholderia translucens TaxID=2886945 RepID=A0ABS8KJF5_9BURK|nr:SUF system Fe-S cluster assembly regulator [Paraburkholderia sp. MMS20-SJTN17]MCC8404911.1 SUF system Fe-S cluster assembly regulator [Paraburkholderia sp. MMS20-SJTN17]